LAKLSLDSGNLANFESFGYKYWFGDLANFWRFFENIWLQIFWYGEMYDLHICTHLLKYSYINLLFLSLLMV